MIVISLGGSLIVPDHVNYKYLKKLSKVLKRLSKKEKLVIVTGGGSTAREYFSELEGAKLDLKSLSLIGIATTKLNARVVASIFNIKSKIPDSVKEVRNQLRKQDIVICGALGVKPNTTTDGNSAEIAALLKAKFFINITNVDGLYDKDPNKFKDAKFIPHLHFYEFEELMCKKKFKPGQHLILDQSASKLINKYKIKTYIIGPDINNLKRCIKGKYCYSTKIG